MHDAEHPQPTSLDDLILVSAADISAKTGLGRATVDALLRRPDAPAPLRLNDRVVVWIEDEVARYLLTRRADRPGTEVRSEPEIAEPVAPRRAPGASKRGRPRKHHV